MVDRRGADQLADKHEEDRVADPEARRDEGHRDRVKGHEGAAEVKMRRNVGRQAHLPERTGGDRAGDRDEQAEIFSFFRQAETDSIEDAVEEFGEGTYSNEELRLVRIKFMSDLGN